jgi:hypothetical protein
MAALYIANCTSADGFKTLVQLFQLAGHPAVQQRLPLPSSPDLPSQRPGEDISSVCERLHHHWYLLYCQGCVVNGYHVMELTFQALASPIKQRLGTPFYAAYGELNRQLAVPIPDRYHPANLGATLTQMCMHHAIPTTVPKPPTSSSSRNSRRSLAPLDRIRQILAPVPPAEVEAELAVKISQLEATGMDSALSEPEHAAMLTQVCTEVQICAVQSGAAGMSGTSPECFLCTGYHLLRQCPLIENLKSKSPFQLRAIIKAVQSAKRDVPEHSPPQDFP